MGPAPKPLLERFLAFVKVDVSTDCWEWTGFRDRKGYPRVRVGSLIDGTRRKANACRVSLELFVGPIAEGLWACHHCDNPGCVNPKHLYVGTAADNGRDIRVRRRAVGKHPDRRGSLNPNYKHGRYSQSVLGASEEG